MVCRGTDFRKPQNALCAGRFLRMAFRRSSIMRKCFNQISVSYQPEYARGVRWNDPMFGDRMADFKSHHLHPRQRIRGSSSVSSVLVTGASGFIGRQCLPILVGQGLMTSHALSRRQPGGINAWSKPGTTWICLDLARLPKSFIKCGRIFLLHLAWYAVPR